MSNLTKQKIAFKLMISQTENMLKNIGKIYLDQSIKFMIRLNMKTKKFIFYKIKYDKELIGIRNYRIWLKSGKKNVKVFRGTKVYQSKEDLYEILDYIQDTDESIFNFIIDVLKKEKIFDILGFLSKPFNLKLYDSIANQQLTKSVVKTKINKFTNVLRNIQDHPFSIVQKQIIRKVYIQEKQYKQIISDQFSQILILLTTIDEKLIQCGSNGLNLLVGIKVDLQNQSFENIRIKNTTLIDGNIVRSNLSGSEFENVDISGMNLNDSTLKIHHMNELQEHLGPVYSLCFFPDGITQASSSKDNSVPTGQFKGHEKYVSTVCFSPDGTTLASCGEISLSDYDYGMFIQGYKKPKRMIIAIGQTQYAFHQKKPLQHLVVLINLFIYGMLRWIILSLILWIYFGIQQQRLVYPFMGGKAGQQKGKLNDQIGAIWSCCLLPDGTTLAFGGLDKSICLWDVKTGQQKLFWMAILFLFYQYASYWMFRQGYKKSNWMVIVIGSTQHTFGQMKLFQHLAVEITLSLGCSDSLVNFTIEQKIQRSSNLKKLTYQEYSKFIFRDLKYQYSTYILIGCILIIRCAYFQRRICESLRNKLTFLIEIDRQLFLDSKLEQQLMRNHNYKFFQLVFFFQFFTQLFKIYALCYSEIGSKI
ncbi:unnamed protein product [Paramecium sonneborni]|uniref:Uncharacterized protein n=1 Tax=Paramecium sonneborni TaxID=65129 RepID=A0A8S1RVK5_9CILI|nr:unnamed protein product [Paramecium sonneborni]